MEDAPGSASACRACGGLNDSAAEHCAHCGEPLTPVGRIFSHAAAPLQPRWLDEARGRAQTLKDEGARSSEVRMQTFVEIDRRREARQAEAAGLQRRRDQLLLRAVGIAFGGFLVIVAIVSLLRLT
jgi:hypothetical protein